MGEVKRIDNILDNSKIKINCYGEIIEIPVKYKERIGIIKIFNNDDKDIFLEISKSDMIQILYVLRDNLQALDLEELEKLKKLYGWNHAFLKHFHYLGIDTEAINEKEKEKLDDIFKRFKRLMDEPYKIENEYHAQTMEIKYMTQSFYNKHKSIIDKMISESFRSKQRKYFNVYFDRCFEHMYIVYCNKDENRNSAWKTFVKMGCPLC
jgi:hypothetical protein